MNRGKVSSSQTSAQFAAGVTLDHISGADYHATDRVGVLECLMKKMAIVIKHDRTCHQAVFKKLL